MKRLSGRVAVVTGAASGIGRALAGAFGEQGMKLVIADVEREPLQRAAAELEAAGRAVVAVPTDVARAEDVEALARRALDAFGAVHVVCNNAGVLVGGLCWEAPLEEYRWVLGVNLWGVIHGIRSFVPILLAQDDEGHVVNTASMAALTSMPFTSSYALTKHAVLSLSETLYHELRMRGSKIGVTAVCPELVRTRIGESARNRPGGTAAAPDPSPERELVDRALRGGVGGGVAPEAIAARVLGAIREERFYVLGEDAGWRRACEARLEDVRDGRNPSLVVPEPV